MPTSGVTSCIHFAGGAIASGTSTALNATTFCGLPSSTIGEVRRREPAHGLAVAIEDGDVEVEDLDAALERRRLLLLRGQDHAGGDKNQPKA